MPASRGKMGIKNVIQYRIFPKNYYLARIGYSCWFYIKTFRQQPLLIYQMGKVASTSVVASLSARHLNVPLFHFHILSSKRIMIEENFYYEKRIGINRKLRSILPEHLFMSYFIRGSVLGKYRIGNKEKWKIITLVRDPITRNISSFFQTVDRQIPDFHKRLDTITYEELYQAFFEKFDHEEPLNWFDLELYPFFGIDVYSSQFPKEKGYKIYSNEQAEMLLIRSENLSNVFSNAISEFLGVENINLVSKNQAKEKKYYSLYRMFLNRVSLPDDYIEKMYSSKLVKHFYTEEEIRKFTSRWYR